MARRIANVYQRKKKNKEGAVVILPTWWIKYRRHGQVFRESTGTTDYEAAKRLLKHREGEVVTGKFRGLGVERVLMQELFDDVRADYLVNRRSSIGSLESRLKNSVRPFFGAIRASEVTTALVNKYIGNRIEAKATNATINRELEVVKRALRLGAICDPPKVSRVPHIAKLKEDNVRRGFLDDEAYLRLRQELPEYLKPMLVVGYHLGNRLGELRSLEWRQIDLNYMQITLDPGTTKNDEGRTLPIYGEMVQWVTMQKAIRDARFPSAGTCSSWTACRSASSARPGRRLANALEWRACTSTTCAARRYVT